VMTTLPEAALLIFGLRTLAFDAVRSQPVVQPLRTTLVMIIIQVFLPAVERGLLDPVRLVGDVAPKLVDLELGLVVFAGRDARGIQDGLRGLLAALLGDADVEVAPLADVAQDRALHLMMAGSLRQLLGRELRADDGVRGHDVALRGQVDRRAKRQEQQFLLHTRTSDFSPRAFRRVSSRGSTSSARNSRTCEGERPTYKSGFRREATRPFMALNALSLTRRSRRSPSFVSIL